MADVVSSFPLLRLPKDAQIHVLCYMNPIEHIGFSLCSVKSKALIESVNLKLRQISFSFGNTIIFVLSTHLNFYFQLEFFVDETSDRGENQTSIKPLISEVIEIGYSDDQGDTTYEWNVTGFTVRDWLFHILSIFNHSKIDEVCFEHYNHIFDIESIRQTIDGLNVENLHIRAVRPNNLFQQLIEMIPTKQLFMDHNPLENRESIHKTLNQNFDLISLFSNFQATLNDLLVMNSKAIRLYRSKLTGKNLNIFLKHWINGSNPRLTFLFIHFNRDSDVRTLDEQFVFKGIEYQVIPAQQQRTIEVIDEYSDGFESWRIEGGLDIQRGDGTNATVLLDNTDMNYRRFIIYVWN